MDNIGKLILIVFSFVITIGFIALIVMFVTKQWRRNNTDLDNGNLKQISAIPPICKTWVDNGTYYFDETYLYFIGSQEKKYLLGDIIEVSKTTSINKKPIVKLVINSNDEKITLKFWPNISVSNKNFNSFVERIKSQNSSAVKFEKYNLLY